MISGQQTLGSINKALSGQQQKIQQVDSSLADLGTKLVEAGKAETDVLRELARERVDFIASSELDRSFDDTEEQVLALLERRRDTATKLQEDMAENGKRLLAQDEQRTAQADVLAGAAEVVDDAEAATQERLQTDTGYQAQHKRATEAERIAMHADEKASRSEQEQQQKGKSYQDDPLFIYLYSRQFGTPQYRANSLIRSLDNWVAGLIAYDDARANYHRLHEIPLRLREHAETASDLSKAELEKLEVLDKRARTMDGIPALDDAEASAQSVLDEIDERIGQCEKEHQLLLQRSERFAAGNDKEYQNMVDFLNSEISREDLRQLRRDAVRTPYPEDDVIVSKLLDLDAEKQELENSRNDMKELARQYRKRLKELEEMRAEFKRRRYDSPRSGFSNGALVGMTLGNFLEGMLKSDALLDVFNNQHRSRRRGANPGFGSGGFGRGSMWGGGSRGGSPGGGFGRRGGGLGGGGGFRTGGGF